MQRGRGITPPPNDFTFEPSLISERVYSKTHQSKHSSLNSQIGGLKNKSCPLYLGLGRGLGSQRWLSLAFPAGVGWSGQIRAGPIRGLGGGWGRGSPEPLPGCCQRVSCTSWRPRQSPAWLAPPPPTWHVGEDGCCPMQFLWVHGNSRKCSHMPL